MTPPRDARRGRRRKRRFAAAWAFRIAFALLVFGAGVALGKALNDNPRPGPDRTFVRTLKPLELPPARETVTVTTTASTG